MKNDETNDTNKLVAVEPEKLPVTEPVDPVKKQSNRTVQIIIAASILVLLCFAAGFGGSLLSSSLSSNTGITPRSQVQDGNQLTTQEEEDIAAVAEKVGPSVVSIITEVPGTRYQSAGQSAGTGIIVGSDGYILTNKHVIDGASTIQVSLSDGTIYENVELLGTDPLNDVAFLKIKDAKNLPAAQLGDSTSVKIGQKVVAIGNSLGQYDNTVTSGIISGVGRPVSAQSGSQVENLTDLIQTDAAINPGNSGGPLLNMNGQVIGINTAVAADAQGIGFSIPINATKGILKGVLAGSKVERAYLGVNYVAIDSEVAKQYDLSVKKGAYVYKENGTAVVSGSPAAKAGIKDKDIITKVGDVEVGSRGGVASLIAEYAPGDTIQLTILRDGKTIVVKTTLAAYNG